MKIDKRIRKYIIWATVVISTYIFIDILLVLAEKNSETASIHNLRDAFWYMIVTLSSVGYGDMVPTTFYGKLIGYFFILTSLLLLGVLISSMSSTIFRMKEENKLGLRGTSFENHIICIGWNDFSRMVVHEVLAAKRNVAIVTNKKDDVDLIYAQYGKENIFVLFADYHNLESLVKTNPNKASDVFFSFDDDTESLIYIIDFIKHYPKPNLVVSIHNHNLKATFQATGVKHVVARNEIASKLVASYVFEPDVADLNIDLLSSAAHDEDFDNQQYLVTENNPYLNKNYDDAFVSLKLKYNIVLLGITKNIDGKQKLIVNARSETIIELGDYLIIMVGGKMKMRVEKLFGIHEGRICC
jgi:voltage-gated potassium channel